MRVLAILLLAASGNVFDGCGSESGAGAGGTSGGGFCLLDPPWGCAVFPCANPGSGVPKVSENCSDPGAGPKAKEFIDLATALREGTTQAGDYPNQKAYCADASPDLRFTPCDVGITPEGTESTCDGPSDCPW